MQIELLLLIFSLLFIASILAEKVGSRFGVPALLLFLAVGMFFGSDGMGVQFDNIKVAQMIGTIALCIILFSGGLNTKVGDIRPVLGAGISLATIGVLIMALCTGVVIYLVGGKELNISLMLCLLLAATMSSTDSASVFSILRGRGVRLKHNLRPTLELESGANDPMAYVLTLTFITLSQQGGNPDWGGAVLMLLAQLAIGFVVGLLLGRMLVWSVNRLNMGNAAFYPLLVMTGSFFVFAVTYYLRGNSFLAVYVAGLVMGNSKFVHKRSTSNFFDGITWLSQLCMFLTLGLLVNPSELKAVVVPGLIISLVMIFVTRPLSVFLVLAPFKKYTYKDRVFVSWVGLRGAVPIIFAILCRASGVEHSQDMFNIVFFCTLVSLVLQGTFLPVMARWLGVADPPPPEPSVSSSFDIDFPEEIKSTASEIEITDAMLKQGCRLMDMSLPEKTLAIMVRRGDNYFVPTGQTVLHRGDRMMVLSDNKEGLEATLKALRDASAGKVAAPKRKWWSIFFEDA